MRLLRELWTTSPRRAAAVALLIVLTGAGTATGSALAGPVLLNRSHRLFGLLAVALLVAVFGELLLNLIAARLTADWSSAIRRRLCAVAFGQNLPTLEGTPVGELLDRIDGDVYQVGAELRNSALRIAESFAVALLSIVITLWVWWPVGVGMLVLAGLLATGLRRPTQRIGPARIEEETAWSDLAAVMEESIHGQDDVRTSLARPYVLKLFAQRASAVLTTGRTVWHMSARVTTSAAAAIRCGIAAVVVAGAWALTHGTLDAARLTSIWLLVLAFGGTVDHISRMVPHLQEGLGAWARIQLLGDSAQERTAGIPPVDGDLVVTGLTYRYATSAGPRRPALADVDLTFARGRSYALIGRTGSGKSTLAKALTRAVDVPAGTVRLGGLDLMNLDLEALRRWVAVVPQRTEILAGTLAENIALFDPALLGAAGHALSELQLDEWVDQLPEGLNTRLGDGGHVLSAGQEQLVAFGRILVRDPQVVILDEATARMDPVTEAQVQRAASRLLHGRIGIVIAHRLSSVRDCDEVVVLDGGRVVEAGPLAQSRRFAELLATGRVQVTAGVSALAGVASGGSGPVPTQVRRLGARAESAAPAAPESSPPGRGHQDRAGPDQVHQEQARPDQTSQDQTSQDQTRQEQAIPAASSSMTLRQIIRLATNDPRFGLFSLVIFTLAIVFGLDGAVLPWLWADLVDGHGAPLWPVVGLVVGLAVTVPVPFYTDRWFPEWWVRQMLRIGLRLVHGQTGARRGSAHTPAEVIAQSGDTERVVQLADNVIDQITCLVFLISMTLIARSPVPGAFFAGTMLLSGVAALGFGPLLERLARATVAARAGFATALSSSLSAARTVKLAGATGAVLDHLAGLDAVRSDRQRREILVQVWARSTPAVVAGLLPIGAWSLFLAGHLTAGATLVAVSTLGAARWFAWTTASLISALPSARVWTYRTTDMSGVSDYSAEVPGVDISAGSAPAPERAPRTPLRRLDLIGFGAVHEDGSSGARGVSLTVERGQLVLVVGQVGAGKSSLLRALAGIVEPSGTLRWNGAEVTEPERFLRPNQVGYVGQLPRVLSGTIADNISLGHEVDAVAAVSTAQLERDLADAGAGLELVIGHKGTRLSGGQLQRLALARALAPRTELLIADDVSSALDVATELQLWTALRAHGVTVIGSTSKRAALIQADHVLVMAGGEAVAQGTWADLEPRWAHLAG